MDFEGGNDKKFAVLAYELIGTCVFMYTILITGVSAAGAYAGAFEGMYFCLLLITWKVSGGHFNPALTVSTFISKKKFKENAALLILMVAGQLVGAFLGWFWAWLTLMDKDY